MFEIIQRDNGVLRFDDNYYYEIEGEYVKVFETKNDFVSLVTTVFSPVRVDAVSIDSVLMAPILTLRERIICKHCNRQN